MDTFTASYAKGKPIITSAGNHIVYDSKRQNLHTAARHPLTQNAKYHPQHFKKICRLGTTQP